MHDPASLGISLAKLVSGAGFMGYGVAVALVDEFPSAASAISATESVDKLYMTLLVAIVGYLINKATPSKTETKEGFETLKMNQSTLLTALEKHAFSFDRHKESFSEWRGSVDAKLDRAIEDISDARLRLQKVEKRVDTGEVRRPVA